MNLKAIIDFDDTLFDTKLLKDDIATVFQSFGVGPQIFWESYKEARDSSDGKTIYTFDRHLRILNHDYIFIDIAAARKALTALLDNSARYVFPDAADFLADLKNRGAELVLLSLGEENFQSEKLQKSGLRQFFADIFLVNDNKLNVLAKIFDPAAATIFINDKVNETKEIFNHFPSIQPVLKVRSDVPLSEYAKSGLLYFSTLSEIKDYLEKVCP